MEASHVIVLAGRERFALPIHSVREVLAPQRLTSVPGVDPSVLGLMNIRGEAVAVLDLRRMLALDDSDDVTRFVVVTSDGRAAVLGVEDVVGLEEISSDAVQESPVSSDRAVAAFVVGVATIGDRLTAFLDVGRLVEAKHSEIAGEVDAA